MISPFLSHAADILTTRGDRQGLQVQDLTFFLLRGAANPRLKLDIYWFRIGIVDHALADVLALVLVLIDFDVVLALFAPAFRHLHALYLLLIPPLVVTTSHAATKAILGTRSCCHRGGSRLSVGGVEHLRFDQAPAEAQTAFATESVVLGRLLLLLLVKLTVFVCTCASGSAIP